MMKLGVALLFAAGFANAQDIDKCFFAETAMCKCPDGSVTPTHLKDRVVRCPDTVAERAANVEGFQRAAEKVKQDEEWALTSAKLAEQIAENAGSIGSGWEETKAELVAERLGSDAFLVEAHAAWSRGVAAKIAADAAQKKRDAAWAVKAAADKKIADAERARNTQVCNAAHNAVQNKKVSDLTVREDELLKACRVLQIYGRASQ